MTQFATTPSSGAVIYQSIWRLLTYSKKKVRIVIPLGFSRKMFSPDFEWTLFLGVKPHVTGATNIAFGQKCGETLVTNIALTESYVLRMNGERALL